LSFIYILIRKTAILDMIPTDVKIY